MNETNINQPFHADRFVTCIYTSTKTKLDMNALYHNFKTTKCRQLNFSCVCTN